MSPGPILAQDGPEDVHRWRHGKRGGFVDLVRLILLLYQVSVLFDKCEQQIALITTQLRGISNECILAPTSDCC